MSNRPSFKEIIKALGLVFGDIGTSPLYTFTAAFAILPITLPNILGIVSLIIWTLIFVVTIQYAWLAMSLGLETEEEGGLIALHEVLLPLIKSKKLILFSTLLTFIGVSFFIGDGVITPAVSILSAVEGLKLISFFGQITQGSVIFIAIIITAILFLYQRRGSEKISLTFGPIMLVWFIFLSVSGLISIINFPVMLHAFNPIYAVKFFIANKFLGFLILSKIILSVTGAEALYADMGHLGRKPILWAWGLVFVSLCFVYLGQGAFLFSNVQAKSSVFHEMVLSQFGVTLYPFFVALGIMATVIASQALISGIFSIVYQGITTRMMPRFYVEYTSKELKSQIFIPTVNLFLGILVIVAILIFKSSENLTNAYGLAVSGTMTITAILLAWIFFLKKSLIKATVSVILIFINLAFLISNIFKIPSGGYLSLLIACVPLFLIVIYTSGRKRLYKSLKQMPLPLFIEKFSMLFQKVPHINGVAVFMVSSIDPIPTYAVQTMFTNNIMYEENILVTVNIQRYAFGSTAMFKEDLAPGLHLFEITIGYMETLDIEKLFTAASIYPKVIFYGGEEIKTKNIFWKIFSVIRKLMPSFVQFYKLPRTKLHGVIVRADM